jgi:hypothetical protein
MGFRRITLSNFKTFGKEVSVPLGAFNVLIGANAAGKSNFIRAFEFLRDLGEDGLDAAVFQQGDVDFLANTEVGRSAPVGVGVEMCVPPLRAKVVDYQGDFIEQRITDVDYRITLALDDGRVRPLEEELQESFSLFWPVTVENLPGRSFESDLGQGKLHAKAVNGTMEALTIEMPPTLATTVGASWIAPNLRGLKLRADRLFISEPSFFLMESICNVGIFDIEPSGPKYASLMTGKPRLEQDADNLAIVLRHIMQDAEKARRLTALVRDVLPFVVELEIESLADKTMLFEVKERYSSRFFPATFLSDGTINVLALIVALYFDERPVAIIEEPERNIHPALIGRVVEMLRDASASKQVIVTTHNPEIIRHAGIEPLLLMSRDGKGFSVVSRPAEREQVARFLENEIGLDELYVQNLLEF